MKYSFDNEGSLVITNGDIYVGFLEREEDMQDFTLAHDLDMYIPYDQAVIKAFEIDKITDWKEWEVTP